MPNVKFANNTDSQYHKLLDKIMTEGHLNKNERTGTGTKSIFGHELRFNLKEGLPIITTKKVFNKGTIHELLWFLGNHHKLADYNKLPIDNIRYLLDNGVNIWVGDLYKAYLKYVNNPLIEDEVTLYCVDDEKESKLRPFTKEEFIHNIKFNDAFALKFGGIGAGYGWQWRNFGGDYLDYRNSFNKLTVVINNESISFPNDGVDQIQQVIETLKTNPQDRRMIVSAWNPSDLDKTVLPPCHFTFSFYARELTFNERYELLCKKQSEEFAFSLSDDFIENSKETREYWRKFELIRGLEIIDQVKENIGIFKLTESFNENNIPKHALSLKQSQRSVDTPLGLPFNITSYAILLELIAKEANMISDELIMYLENTHIYLNQIDGVKEQLSRKSVHELPTLHISENKSIFDLTYEDIKIENYKSQDTIKFLLSN